MVFDVWMDQPDPVWEKLVTAVTENDAKSIYEAVEAGADVNGRIGGHQPLMHLAIEHNALQSMVALGEKGYDFALEDPAGRTALQQVLGLMELKVTQLHGKKADPNAMLEILLAMGDDPKREGSKREDGTSRENAIYLAHEMGFTKIANHLKDIADGREKRLQPHQIEARYGPHYYPEQRATNLRRLAKQQQATDVEPVLTASDIAIEGKVKPHSDKDLGEEAIRRSGGRC